MEIFWSLFLFFFKCFLFDSWIINFVYNSFFFINSISFIFFFFLIKFGYGCTFEGNRCLCSRFEENALGENNTCACEIYYFWDKLSMLQQNLNSFWEKRRLIVLFVFLSFCLSRNFVIELDTIVGFIKLFYMYVCTLVVLHLLPFCFL